LEHGLFFWNSQENFGFRNKISDESRHQSILKKIMMNAQPYRRVFHYVWARVAVPTTLFQCYILYSHLKNTTIEWFLKIKWLQISKHVIGWNFVVVLCSGMTPCAVRVCDLENMQVMLKKYARVFIVVCTHVQGFFKAEYIFRQNNYGISKHGLASCNGFWSETTCKNKVKA